MLESVDVNQYFSDETTQTNSSWSVCKEPFSTDRDWSQKQIPVLHFEFLYDQQTLLE